MSRTEAALAALAAALAAKAAEPDAAIPAPMRNEILPTNFPQFAEAGFWLNLLDGDGTVDEKLLGDPDGESDAYEITHRAASVTYRAYTTADPRSLCNLPSSCGRKEPMTPARPRLRTAPRSSLVKGRCGLRI